MSNEEAQALLLDPDAVAKIIAMQEQIDSLTTAQTNLSSSILALNDEVERLNGVVATGERLVELMRAQKDNAYSERNSLVSFISKIYPSWLGRHPMTDTEWDQEWMTLVYVNSPAGQLSWHIHDSETAKFSHLQESLERPWDGHTTEEKYTRLSRLPQA